MPEINSSYGAQITVRALDVAKRFGVRRFCAAFGVEGCSVS